MFDDFGHFVDEDGKVICPAAPFWTVALALSIMATAWTVPFVVPYFR